MTRHASQESAAASARQARGRRLAGLLAGPLAAALVLLAPLPALTPEAHRLAAILAGVVCYWIAEPIPLPVTALLGTALCALAGLGSVSSVFAAYAHPIIFLFIGSFCLAQGLAVHGVDRRFAARVLALPWVAGRPSRILLALGTVTAVISMGVSNTATAALMLPVAQGLLATLRDARPAGFDRYRIGALLFLSYAATAGGTATLIGTPPNLIGAGLIAQETGVPIPFQTWLAFGLPLAAVLLLASWILVAQLFPADEPVVPGLAQYLQGQRAAMGPWTRGQINACLAFGVAVGLWVAPGLLTAIAGPESGAASWMDRHLPNELVALLAAGLLFVLPADWKAGIMTLSWREAARINWGTILLFGGGLAFGDLMLKTGLSDAVGRGVVEGFGIASVWSLTAGAIVVAILVSELTSNTATASMLVPLVIAIAQSAQVPAVPPALGACLGASLGFALPVSTPPNAIVYGTGLIPLRSMLRAGLLLDLVGAILIWLTLRLVCPLLGLA
ncbi:SLC13 family permease [Nitrospira sp. Kam-Ns4a]